MEIILRAPLTCPECPQGHAFPATWPGWDFPERMVIIRRHDDEPLFAAVIHITTVGIVKIISAYLDNGNCSN